MPLQVPEYFNKAFVSQRITVRPMPEVLCRRYSKKQVVRAGGNELLSASRGSEVR